MHIDRKTAPHMNRREIHILSLLTDYFQLCRVEWQFGRLLLLTNKHTHDTHDTTESKLVDVVQINNVLIKHQRTYRQQFGWLVG